MNSIRRQTFFDDIFFPPTTGVRVLHHVAFWIFYVILHFAYSVPTLADAFTDPRVSSVGVLYFFKTVPNYYLCVGLFYFLQKYLKGVMLGLVLLISVIVLQHILNMLFFLFVDAYYGFDRLPERFTMIAKMYLDFRFSNYYSWLAFSYSLSEVELLMFPAAVKLGKYAARESLMRQKLQNDSLNMELRVLKTQINPHFVFNVINAAYAKILPISEEAAEYLQKSAEIMRFALYEANDEWISLEKEMDYVRQYVELESVRSTRRCKISLVEEGDIRPAHQIPTLLLITLVENAFKHGVHASRLPSFVDIKIHTQPEKLNFSVENSIPEHAADDRKVNGVRTGIGLANLKKRMDIYFPGSHQFDAISQDNTFKVILSLPLSRPETSTKLNLASTK